MVQLRALVSLVLHGRHPRNNDGSLSVGGHTRLPDDQWIHNRRDGA